MSFASDSISRKLRQRRADRRPAVRQAARTTIESLERRQLLAFVPTGQVGVYEGANGPVRVTVQGSSGAGFDLIGASLDSDGQPRLHEIPMTIFDQVTGQVVRQILGGYGGRDGIEPITRLSGFAGNGVTRGDTPPYSAAANGQINIGGLASDVRGRSYGVNIFQAGPNESVAHILHVDTNTGEVTLKEDISGKMIDALQALNPEFAADDLLSVIGADFDPADERTLYFAANVDYPFVTGTGTGANVTRKAVPAMFKYDVKNGSVTVDPQFFGVGGQQDNVRIDSFSFKDDGTIVMYGSVQFDGQGQAVVGLFDSDKDNVIPSNGRQVWRMDNGNRTVLTTTMAALEFIPGENTIIAVTDRTNTADLIAINPDTGNYTIYGTAVDPDDTSETKLGATIGDLDWNKRFIDQFFQPGKRGVLMGTDMLKDRLVGYDARERFQTPDLYAVYGDTVKPDTSISISTFTLDPDSNIPFNSRLYRGVMNPYDGSPGSIRINNANYALDNGSMYMGVRTLVQNAPVTPVYGLNSQTQFSGNRTGVSLPTIVRPGVYIKGSIDKFLFGGTITGAVNIDGSIDTFYAGNVITGAGAGQTDNFFVNGDIRQLVVRGSFGTFAAAPDAFNPSSDIHVNGRIQQIKVGGEFKASADIGGKTSELSIITTVDELETEADSRLTNAAGLAFEGRLYPSYIDSAAGSSLQPLNNASTGEPSILDPVTNNNSFDTPQVLGTFYSRERKTGGQVTVSGTLNNGSNFGDSQDYYGMPLLAGQTIQVGVVSGDPTLPVILSVIDPDGRVYAEDVSNQNTTTFLNQRFSVTADKPGIWRLRVSVKAPLSTALINAFRPYLLTVDKAGELGLGGLVTGGRMNMARPDLGVKVRNADLGAILAGGALIGASAVDLSRREPRFLNAAQADSGNIRSLEGASISQLTNGVYSGFPNFKAPKGSIGLIRANAASAEGAFIYFNNDSYATTAATTGRPADDITIGGDYQVIETIGDFSAILSTNKGIGVIRVGSVAQNIIDLPGYYEINADNKGSDGYIGLIDCAANFGTFTWGGPAIWAGEGSNIRYLRIGGAVYSDYAFASGTPTVLTARDRAVSVTDDSGATITITPFAGTITRTNTPEGGTGTGTGTGTGSVGNGGVNLPDPFGGNGDPSQGSNGIPDPFGGNGSIDIPSNIPDPFNGANNPPGTPVTTTTDIIVGDLSISTYAVRSGGVIVYDVASTTGVKVAVSRKGGGGSGDIGRITTSAATTNAAGLPVALGVPIVNPANAQDELRFNPTRLAPLILGTGTTLDLIFDGGTVNVFDIDAPNGQFSRILNNTGGEIVNLTANSVGYLAAQYLGVARPAGAVKLEGLQNATDSRFTQVNGYPFDQPRNMIFLTRAIDIRSRGPIGNIAIEDVVQNIAANSDGKNEKGIFEGIVAPIVAEGLSFATDVTGDIRRIDIGEGIAGGVTGTLGNGIYANGSIGLITNANGGGDIRGDIVAGDYIEAIRLTGGSILDADIYSVIAAGTTDGIAIGGFGVAVEDFRLSLDIFVPVINESLLTGIGSVTVSGNGGIINSRFVGYRIGQVTTDKAGFGIFTSEFSASSGGGIVGINAGGLGIRGTVIQGGAFLGNIIATGTGAVRSVSEFATSVRGTEFNYFDGITGIAPNAANDLHLFLGTTRTKNKVDGTTNDGVIQDSRIGASRDISSVQAWEIRTVNNLLGARPRDDTYPTQINVGGKIGKVKALRNINGIKIVAASVDSIEAGRDLIKFDLSTNDRVKQILVGRHMLGSAEVNINGEGSLDLLKVGGNINGILFAANGIRTIDVGGDFAPDGTRGGIRSGGDINILRVGGNIMPNAFVRATRGIKLLDVAGDVRNDSIIRARSIGTQKIGGVVYGDIIIG